MTAPAFSARIDGTTVEAEPVPSPTAFGGKKWLKDTRLNFPAGCPGHVSAISTRT